MADEELQAKVTLDAAQFQVAIDGIVSKLGSLEGAFTQVGAKLDNSLAKGLGNVKKGLDGLNLDAAADKLNAAASKMAGALAATIQPAADFEAAMRNVNTIAKLSEPQYEAFSEQLRTLGSELKIGVKSTEAATAAYQIYSAGIEGTANVQEVLKQSLIGAKAGLSDTKTAADAITTVMNAYNLSAADAARINDVLFKTVEKGKTTYGELAGSIGSVAGIAAQSGVSIEELSAVLQVVTRSSGGPGGTSKAIDGLRAAITALAAPTEEARKTAAQYGITLDDNFLKSRGFAAAIQEIATKTGGSSTALRRILGDVNGLSVVLATTGKHAGEFKTALGDAFNAAGSSQAALTEQQKSFSATVERLTSSFEALKIKAGEALLPALRLAATAAESMIKVLEGVPGPLLGLSVGLAALGAVGLTTAGAIAGIASTVVNLGPGLDKARGLATKLGSGVAKLSGVAGTAVRVLGGLGAIGLAVAAGMAVGTAGAAALQGAINYLNRDALEAEATLQRLRGLLREGLLGNADVIGQTAQEIANTGKGVAEIAKVLGGLRQQRLDAIQGGDKELAASLDILIKEQEQKIRALESGAVRAQKVTQDAGNLTGEALKQKLHEAEIQSKTDKDHLASLEQILGQIRFEGDERRSVETKIHELRKKIARDEESSRKKALSEQIANEIQSVQHAKDGIDQQIAKLEELRQKYIKNGAARRQIEDEIAKKKKEKAKEEEELIKRTAELQKQAAEQRKAAAEGRRQDLERTQSRGVDVSGQIIDQIRAEGEATKDKIREQLKKDLADPKNKTLKVELRRQADVAITQVDRETGRRVQQVRDQAGQDQAQVAGEQIALERRVSDARLEAYKQQLATGKDVGNQLRQEILNQYKLEERRIKLEADAAKQATDNATLQRQIELQAQADIYDARQRANQAFRDANDLIDEQKRKLRDLEKGPIKGGREGAFDFTLGSVQTVGQAFGTEETTSNRDNSIAARRAASAAADAQRRFGSQIGPSDPGSFLGTLQRQPRRLTALTKGAAANLARSTGTQQINVKTSLDVNVNVTYPTGQTTTQRTTLAGVPAPGAGAGSVGFSPRGRA